MKKIINYFKSCPLYIQLTFLVSHVFLTSYLYGIQSYFVQDYTWENWKQAILVTIIAITFTMLVTLIVETTKRRKKETNVQ